MAFRYIRFMKNLREIFCIPRFINGTEHRVVLLLKESRNFEKIQVLKQGFVVIPLIEFIIFRTRNLLVLGILLHYTALEVYYLIISIPGALPVAASKTF